MKTLLQAYGIPAVALLALVSWEVCSAQEYYPSFIIIRYFADGAEQRLKQDEAKHRAHVAAKGRAMAIFRILNDDGGQIGIGSWSAFDNEEDARAFVEQDPYHEAGLYRGVSITEADVYLLDKWFSIVPGWLQGKSLETSHQEYERLVHKKRRVSTED